MRKYREQFTNLSLESANRWHGLETVAVSYALLAPRGLVDQALFPRITREANVIVAIFSEIIGYAVPNNYDY